MTFTPTPITDFGAQLIKIGDLDPVYIGLFRATLPADQLARLLLAYWCFYHLGAAANLSDRQGGDFWHGLREAAINKDGSWPRASERRHFRGVKCVDAVEWLFAFNHSPEHCVKSLVSLETEYQIMNAVKAWPMFGPWIAFKAADMIERVWGAPVKFDPNIGLLYDEPRTALRMLAQDNPQSTEHIYQSLLEYFATYPAPPRGDRFCGPQEVETILCKWKSHAKGHYWVGKDIKEVRHALEGWGPTARKILWGMPEMAKEVAHA